MHVDLLAEHATELVTCATGNGRPKRGVEMDDVGIIHDGAVAIHRGRIVAVGPTAEVHAQVESADRVIDAHGHSVIPGLVDPHTHAVWAGDRAAEFEMRLKGASYLEILEAGGGILRTVRDTREASLDDLVLETRQRLDRMLLSGTTTAEVKTGYGLDEETELKMLDAIRALDESNAIDLIPTFLGAHAVPPEYADNPDAYVDFLVEEMIPHVASLQYRVEERDEAGDMVYAGYERAAWFCDVFCERGAFSLEQTRRILEAAKAAGMDLKVHVDEFEPSLGAVPLAVELGAVSVDHLLSTPEEHLRLLAQSETAAVGLPGTPFGLAEQHYTRGRFIIDAGGILAIATDLNPGTTWCESMPMMMALATRYMGLTPAEALNAATTNAAYAIKMSRYVGSIEVGKQGDLVILDVPDYRHLSYRYGSNLVHTVIKTGRVVVEDHKLTTSP